MVQKPQIGVLEIESSLGLVYCVNCQFKDYKNKLIKILTVSLVNREYSLLDLESNDVTSNK